MIRSTGADVPVLLIVTEGGLAAITFEWGVDDVPDSALGQPKSRPACACRSVGCSMSPTGGSCGEIRSGELVIDEATYGAAAANVS